MSVENKAGLINLIRELRRLYDETESEIINFVGKDSLATKIFDYRSSPIKDIESLETIDAKELNREIVGDQIKAKFESYPLLKPL